MRLELKYSAALVKALKNGEIMPNAEVFKHTDGYTAGIPDISVNWLITSWLEVKVADEKGRMEGRGIQLATAVRLARTVSCWYIIYEPAPRLTHVVHPDGVARVGDYYTFGPLVTFDGIDHGAVARWLREHHVSRARGRA